MKRRELIKTIAAVPFASVLVGKEKAQAVKIEPDASYVLVMDVRGMPASALEYFRDSLRHNFPEGHPLHGAPIIGVRPQGDQTIHDVFAIYKLPGEKP
jgi:hypothetical protein